MDLYEYYCPICNKKQSERADSPESISTMCVCGYYLHAYIDRKQISCVLASKEENIEIKIESGKAV